MKLKKGIEIHGTIYKDDGDIDFYIFLDKFIEFVESNDWNFGGATYQIDENKDLMK